MCSTTKSKFSPLGRHLPGTHRVDGVGDVAQGIGHVGQAAGGPGKALGLHRRRGGRKNRAQPLPRQGHRRAEAHPAPGSQRQHAGGVGGGQRPHRAARHKDPRAAPPLAGEQAGRPQAAQRHTEGRIAQLGTGRRQGGRQGDAEYRRLLQRPGDGCAEPRRSRQCQARSQRSEGTALEAGRPHRQPEAGPARLLYRKTEKRPADSRRQQGRASRGDGLARVQDAPRQKNAQGLDGQQRKAPGPGRRAGIAAAEPPPRHGSRQRPRQFEPHGHRLKEQTPRQRPHAGSQQIGRRTPDDQRQPEGRGAAVDLPGAQHRPRDSRGPLPGQRRPPRPRGQQRLQPERRSMYLLVGIGKDSHRSVPPLCCMPYGSCTIPRGNRRFLPQAGEIQKLVGNCAFVPRPDKPCRKSRQKSGVPGRSPQNNKKDGPRAQSSRRGRPQLREK